MIGAGIVRTGLVFCHGATYTFLITIATVFFSSLSSSLSESCGSEDVESRQAAARTDEWSCDGFGKKRSTLQRKDAKNVKIE